MNFVADYTYGEVDTVSNPEESLTVYGAGGFYDTMVWDEFIWDSPVQNRAKLELNGLGTNISFVWFGSSTYEDPHILSAHTIIYGNRKMIR